MSLSLLKQLKYLAFGGIVAMTSFVGAESDFSYSEENFEACGGFKSCNCKCKKNPFTCFLRQNEFFDSVRSQLISSFETWLNYQYIAASSLALTGFPNASYDAALTQIDRAQNVIASTFLKCDPTLFSQLAGDTFPTTSIFTPSGLLDAYSSGFLRYANFRTATDLSIWSAAANTLGLYFNGLFTNNSFCSCKSRVDFVSLFNRLLSLQRSAIDSVFSGNFTAGDDFNNQALAQGLLISRTITDFIQPCYTNDGCCRCTPKRPF